MPPLDLRNNDQKLADRADAQSVEMWRAARTVCERVSEPAARDELLECLGLLGVTRPAGV